MAITETDVHHLHPTRHPECEMARWAAEHVEPAATVKELYRDGFQP